MISESWLLLYPMVRNVGTTSVTSALDPETERAIVGNILALRGQSTIIAITHRTAFVDIADQVYELAEGRVV